MTEKTIDESILNEVKEVATRFHLGQNRKTGEPYINHPIRVSESLTNMDEKIIALLHDVLEDTECKVSDLEALGYRKEIIDAIISLTRKKGETYFDFIFRVKRNNLATRVKMADISDNLRDLEEGSLKDKYRFALFILKLSD